MNKRTRAVELAREGLSGRQIAETLGLKPRSVHTYLSDERQIDPSVPSLGNRPGARLSALPQDVRHAFALASLRRGLSPQEFITLVLCTIAREDLFGAVLDDGGADD